MEKQTAIGRTWKPRGRGNKPAEGRSARESQGEWPTSREGGSGGRERGEESKVEPNFDKFCNRHHGSTSPAQRTVVQQPAVREIWGHQVVMRGTTLQVAPTRGRQLQQLYGWSVLLSMVSQRREGGARDKPPPVTNLQRRARDAFNSLSHRREQPNPVNEHSPSLGVGRACRAPGHDWQRQARATRCWLDRVPYDESRYFMALQKRGARLLKHAAQTS